MRKYGWLLGLLALAACDDVGTGSTEQDASVRDAFVGRDFSVRDAAVRVDATAPGCQVNEDCAANEVCVNGECLDERPPPDCLRDEDCANGEVCEAGACVPGPECVEDADCGAGRVCAGGSCEDAPPECVDDTDCGLDEICQGGDCVAGPMPECRGDGDCAVGEVCQAGECVAGPMPECRDDADCDAGQTCVAGACEDAPPPPECVRNADCGAGQICVAGACEDAPPPPECQAHADCLPDQLCVNGVCQDAPPPACMNDQDCSLGEACVAGACQPVQAGDCNGAVALNGFGAVNGTTLGAANGFAGSCGGDLAPEVVYAVVVPQAGEICVSTTGSAIDTVLYVRTGDCVNGPEAGCNDDAADLTSEVTVRVVDANPVYVFVDGFDGEEGDYTLTVSAGPCAGVPADCIDDADCAANEICDAGVCVGIGPIECAADADCAVGELCVDGLCAPEEAGTCDAPFIINAFAEFRGSTAGAVGAFEGSCGGARGPEAVYAFALDGPGEVCLSTVGSNFDTVLHVRADDCAAGAEVDCNDDAAGGLQSQLTVQAEANVAYYVFVDSFNAPGGDYVLTVSPGPCAVEPECAVDADCALGEICDAGACVPAPVVDDGTCDAPTPIVAFGPVQGSTAGRVAADEGSCGGVGPEVVYVFSVDGPGDLCLSTAGSPTDTVLHVRSTLCADPASEVDCNDDAVGTTSEITLAAEANVDYFVFVDSFRAAGGAYTFTLSPGPCGAAPACVVDADCAAGQICDAGACVAAPVVGDGTCDAPTPIVAFGAINGTTVGKAAAQRGVCGGAGPEDVYVFSVDGPGDICVSTGGSGFDTVLHVRANDCAVAAGEIGCNDDTGDTTQSELTIAAEADVNYFVFVDSFFAGGGAYTFTITPGACGAVACAADADCGADQVCDAGVCAAAPVAANGTCEAPNPIVAAGALNGVTAGQGASAGSCGGGPASPEAIYAFAVDAATPVCLDTNGSALDTVLYVRTTCDDAASELGCNDDNGAGGFWSRLQVQAVPGVDYFVYVDGYTSAFAGPSAGAYTLNVTLGACP